MKTRYVLVVGAALLAVVGATIAQQNTHPVSGPSVLKQQVIPPTDVPTAPQRSVPPIPNQDPLLTAATFPRQQTVPAKPEDLTIDQLIEAVDGFREQKAEIEKKERAYLKVLHRKAQSQKERIDGLGGDGQQAPPTLVPGPVPSTSYVIPPAIGSIPVGPN
ncbi:hypothetical protein R5W23_000682 [Gemmata sp. JC673]|uniref:Uncharacterized protein n=1 Tax=Gemmata algarum TaxID=2975278 RepID=A0ABU5EWJ4_9BACT|nr:hypothetical protein [Gemmata algarum]MDY3559671.1 hypothetical protein [Gemmata algarum]